MEVIKQSPDDLLIYEARLKRQRDESTAIQAALREGKALGRAEGEQIGQVRGEQIGQVRGEQIGQIRLLEQMLGLQPSRSDELATRSMEQLAATVEDLRRRLDVKNQS